MLTRRATLDDVPSITACVCEAYVHYIERIGMRPGPMLEDFAETVEQSQVHVACDSHGVAGVIVLQVTPEGFYVDDVAVRPRVKGTGVGKLLLQLAEAQALQQGYSSVYLATHELMTENQALYEKIGYSPYDHRVVNGYPRVFMRKQLA
ncbi:MAG: GNAT family N-acetyltransferase [Burkholderiales bacterium]|nr:GNAT family N-acetyltransferase [Burkholderiales bacterium]